MSSSRQPDTGTEPGTGPAATDEPGRRKTRRSFSLRIKLIASFTGVVVLLSLTIGVVTEAFLSNYLVSQVDQRLGFAQERGGPTATSGQSSTSTTPTTATATKPQPGAGGPGSDDQFNTITSCSTVQGTTGGFRGLDGLWGCAQGGRIVLTSVRDNFLEETLTSSDDAALLAAVSTTAAGSTTNPTTVTLSVGDYRVVAHTNSSGVTVITGASLQQVSNTQVRLALIMALVAGGAIVIGGLLIFWIVRRSVRPLERVAATARKVSTLELARGAVDLSVRVPDRDTDTRTEIGQVGAALNQMLGHVSGALESRHASETRVRQFVADASHELRTPLAAIRGYAELARRGEHDPAAVGHALRRVESESARMTTLVEDLLLLARLDSGRPLAQEEVDLTMLLIDRVSDARVAGPDHRWQLDLPDEPLTVVGDTQRLHQVVANLLTNARNHTPPGTLVVAGVREERNGVLVTVTDNGPGIPAELQPEIFGRFVRGDSSRSRAAGSTGLGLAIVAAVVAAHGGTVAVESRPGLTRAKVWLPTSGRPAGIGDISSPTGDLVSIPSSTGRH